MNIINLMKTAFFKLFFSKKYETRNRNCSKVDGFGTATINQMKNSLKAFSSKNGANLFRWMVASKTSRSIVDSFAMLQKNVQ